LWSAAVLLAFSAALLYLSWWAYKRPWNISDYSFDRGRKRSESNLWLVTLPAVVGGVILFVHLITFPWLVWFAPKVWLIRELAGLLK